MLAPLASRIEGELLRPDGTTAALTLRVTLDEAFAVASYPDAAGQQRGCEGGLTLKGTLQAVGGDALSGTAPVDVAASGQRLGLQLSSLDFETSLHPEDNPCATAGVMLALELDASCVWHGDWSVAPPLASSPAVTCSPSPPLALGMYSAEGDCSGR